MLSSALSSRNLFFSLSVLVRLTSFCHHFCEGEGGLEFSGAQSLLYMSDVPSVWTFSQDSLGRVNTGQDISVTSGEGKSDIKYGLGI